MKNAILLTDHNIMFIFISDLICDVITKWCVPSRWSFISIVVNCCALSNWQSEQPITASSQVFYVCNSLLPLHNENTSSWRSFLWTFLVNDSLFDLITKPYFSSITVKLPIQILTDFLIQVQVIRKVHLSMMKNYYVVIPKWSNFI